MKDLSVFDKKNLKISSREIADLCGKRHGNVIRDIEKLNDVYVRIAELKIEESQYINDLTSRSYKEYLLTYGQCLDLVTGYNTEMRVKINRRWLELEEQSTQEPLPTTTLPDYRDQPDAVSQYGKLAMQYDKLSKDAQLVADALQTKLAAEATLTRLLPAAPAQPNEDHLFDYSPGYEGERRSLNIFGLTLSGVFTQGEWHVPFKKIVTAAGLEYKTQRVRMQNRCIRLREAGGRGRASLHLSLSSLKQWLLGVQLNRVGGSATKVVSSWRCNFPSLV